MNDRSKLLGLILCLFLLLLVAGCEEGHHEGPQSPTALPPGAQLASLSFVDATHGWVVAASCSENAGTPTEGCRALVYATTDGGHSWSAAGRLLLTPRKMQFTDQSTGWLVGSIGSSCGANPCPNVVMQTTDAGHTWTRTLTTSVDLIDAIFASPRDGWILAQSCASQASCQATLVATASTGQTWVNQKLPLTGHDFRLARLSPLVGWVGAIEDGQAVLIGTKDDGKHWDKIETPCRGDSLAFDFQSPTGGWLACSAAGARGSEIFHTANGGQTWQTLTDLPAALHVNLSNQGQPQGAGLAMLHFTSQDDGWIADDAGNVVATHDGGKTWEPSLTAKQSLVAGSFNDPTHGWLIGSQAVWTTANGGKTWNKTVLGGDSRSASRPMRVE